MKRIEESPTGWMSYVMSSVTKGVLYGLCQV